MSLLHNKSIVLTSVSGVWFLIVVLGSAALWQYKYTPGTDALAPPTWPAASKLQRAPDRPTLVLFVHPRCACTQASLGELNRLMAHSQGLVSAQVVFFRPLGSAPGWAKGPLFTAALALDGVSVSEDEDGREARIFSARTSGHVVLYDRSGQRIFDGGITAARGHAGDNAGLNALLALLHRETPQQQHTGVFGCPIQR
jgi:hypothetical protein